MAGSFSVSTSNGYISGSINWSENTIDTANNRSNVYAEMRLSRTNSGYTSYGTDTFWIKINGTQVSNTLTYTLTQNSNTLMVSGTVTVPHNSDGSKTVLIEWGGGGGSGGVFTVNYGSGNAVLTTIARAASVNSGYGWIAGTQSLPVNISTYDTSYHYHMALQVQDPSGNWVTVADRTGITGTSYTFNFTEAENTTAYQQISMYESRPSQIYVDTYDSSNNFIGETVATGNVYAVATTTATLNSNNTFNIGSNVPVTLSPFFSNTGFTYELDFTFGSFTKTFSGITSSSYTMNFTTSDANSMYSQIPNANSGVGAIRCRTYYNGVLTEDGNPTSDSTSFTANVTNSNPTFGTGYTYQDTKTATKNLTGNNQYIIQNQSTVEVDLPSNAVATGVNSATISYYLATLGSTTVKRNIPSAAPSASVSANAGSTVATTTHYIKFTWVDANGESLPSPELAYTVPSSGNNLVITLPSRPTGVTTTKVYVSTTAGGETLQGSTTGTTYTMSAPPTTGGATVPTTMPFIIGTLNASSNATLSMQAVDSRGNSTTTTKTVNVVPYSAPVVNTTAARGSGFNSTVTLTLSGTVSPLTVSGNNKNSLKTTTYAYGQTGNSLGAATAFTGVSTALPNYSATNVTLTMDNTASWNVQVIVADQLATTTINMVVQKGVPLVFIDATKQSVGIGQFPANNSSLEVAGTIHTSNKTLGSGGSINMHNSDIIGVNALYWNDTATGNEGLNFIKTGATVGSTTGSDYDTIRALDGDLYLNTHYMCPTGMINMYAASSAPTGWLVCDGSAISRTTYSKLYGVIGTTYGAGDGSTTFNLPNLKGNAPVGVDSGQTEFNTLGKTGGEKTHTLTTNEMPSHGHNIQGNGGGGSSSGYWNQVFYNSGGGNTATQNYTDAQGGGGAHNNLQPYIALNFIIKT